MTNNWDFKYMSTLNQFYFAYIRMPGFLENVQNTLQFNNTFVPNAITYPFFKVRLYGLDEFNVQEWWWWEQTGFSTNYRQRGVPRIQDERNSFNYPNIKTKNTYVTGFLQLFDNLGTIAYTEDLNNGKLNVNTRFGDQSLKVEIVECTTQNLGIQYEVGVVWEGNINLKNSENPAIVKKEYGEATNNQLSATDKRFAEFQLSKNA